MRKQYQFCRSERGLLAWDIDRLAELTAGFTPIDVPLSEIRELDETFWFDAVGQTDERDGPEPKPPDKGHFYNGKRSSYVTPPSSFASFSGHLSKYPSAKEGKNSETVA
jgi:hypothetical protein